MKRSFLFSSKAGMALMIACAGLVMSLGACKKSSPVEVPVGEATVRYVNASSGSLAQDFYVNGAKKNTTPLAYGSASAYFTIISGPNTFTINDAGSATANATVGGEVSIADKLTGYYYKNAEGKNVAAFIGDAVATPPAGKANVRFIHINSFSTTAFAVKVTGATDPLIPSLAYQTASGYFPVDGSTKFDFVAGGVTLSAAYDGLIVAGKSYTIWVDGSLSTPFSAHIVE